MIVFEIRNYAENRRLLGYLFYYDRSKRFFTELLSDSDEWSAPFIFAGHVKKGEYSIDSVWSKKFVNQRIIPPDRQNLGSILKENGLKAYDEYKLLQLSEGRGAQDELYLVRISEKEIASEIKSRLTQKVHDVMVLNNYRVMVFFKDGMSRIINIKELCSEERLFGNIIRNPDAFRSVRLSPGGNGIEWDEERFLSAEKLRKNGKNSEIKYEDVNEFIIERLADTAEATRMLNCSRQYINQLVDSKRLTPIREVGNSGVFLKGALEVEI